MRGAAGGGYEAPPVPVPPPREACAATPPVTGLGGLGVPAEEAPPPLAAFEVSPRALCVLMPCRSMAAGVETAATAAREAGSLLA